MDNIGKRVVSDDIINQIITSDIPKLVRLLWPMDEYIANATATVSAGVRISPLPETMT
jgi:hypothetical protein